MAIDRRAWLLVLGCLSIWFTAAVWAAPPPDVAFQREPDRLWITIGGRRWAAYVFVDERIPRPYFAHVKSPAGVQVTRRHPPRPGVDDTDHATYHPGLWMAFGDLSGHDNWRLKAAVVQESFAEEPEGGPGRGVFAVVNRYTTDDRKGVVCTELRRCTILVRPSGYLLLWDSLFRADHGDFYFGDQEEMGLGVRVATPIAVRHGGRILDSEGRVNEEQVWGTAAKWCDYSGVIEGQPAGVTLMSHPDNFRPSWHHARDYGCLVANPFGRRAMTGGESSKVVVRSGQSLRLRFGVAAHSGPYDPAAAYEDFLRAAAGRP